MTELDPDTSRDRLDYISTELNTGGTAKFDREDKETRHKVAKQSVLEQCTDLHARLDAQDIHLANARRREIERLDIMLNDMEARLPESVRIEKYKVFSVCLQ
ncbi:hypothetical protein B0H17DRAFT_1333607, partial [Mycena rosella]